MVKSLKKSAKRAADDRQQDPSAANIDPRTEADIGRLVDKYKNRSESSLMDELLRVTCKNTFNGFLICTEQRFWLDLAHKVAFQPCYSSLAGQIRG